ncbi:hypothetical protein FRB98_002769, partial [Tulasnella sp. 332]
MAMIFPQPDYIYTEPEEFSSDETEQRQDCTSSGVSYPFPESLPVLFPPHDPHNFPSTPSRNHSAPPKYGDSPSYTPSCMPPPRAYTEPAAHQASSLMSDAMDGSFRDQMDRDRGFGDQLHRDWKIAKQWVGKKFGHIAPSPPAAQSHSGPSYHPGFKPSLQENQHWHRPTPGPTSHITFLNLDAHIHVHIPPHHYWPTAGVGQGGNEGPWHIPAYRYQ